MTERGWQAARIDEIPRAGDRREWVPLRRHFGIQAFGVNAWVGDVGARLIPDHDESSIGHEELYVVVVGRAMFTIGEDEIDAPAGTILFVRDPGIRRSARAAADGTTILTAGAKPGAAFTVSPWERNAEVMPLFESGDFAEARRLLEPLVAEHPRSGGLLYNLACAEARLGETEAALEHLGRAVEIDRRFAEYAQSDEDLESLRADPRFPAPAEAS